MKKEYQKPVVACTDMNNKKTISNSATYGNKVLQQEWMKDAERQGIVYFAEEYAVNNTGSTDQNERQKFRSNPEFIYREIAGESVLIPNGRMAGKFNGLASLNGTGVFLWKLLEKERTIQELSSRFAEEYELSEEQSREDVTAFLKLGLSRELIIRC